jgi:asparagine synthase
MSFYVASGEIDRGRLQSVAAELASPGKEALMQPGPAGWLWVDDDPERFGPAVDPATNVRMICSGRLAWSAHEWQRAARLPYAGGLAGRLILERYLGGGASAVTPYNGAVAIALHDPRDDTLHFWTDQFGYHPCFVYRGDDAAACIVTTFPDLLVADSHARLTYDAVSMAEFVRGWRATPPNTYFAEVKHAGAATHLTIDRRAGRVSKREYWRPFEDDFHPSIGAAAEDLAAAVRVAVEERTAAAARPLFFVSGGADSRVLLFSAADRGRVTAVNLYERAAQETEIARRLTETAGCRFVAIQRDNDFYPRNLPDTVRWSGAMWSAEDAHYPGFGAQIAAYSPDLVMTACTTDWVFKGYGLEKQHRPLLGRSLPILSYLDERVDGFLPNVALPAPPIFAAAIRQRLDDWFAGCPRHLSTPRDRLRVEDRRIRPTAYAVSVSGPIMYRRFPYDTFLADSRVAACYSRAHPDWKLNRELWGKAAARICAGAGTIVDSNWGWRVDASTAEKLAVFAVGWLGRRVRAAPPAAPQDDHRPASSGSWPDYGWYAKHSPTLTRLWESVTPEERRTMALVCGDDALGKPLADWSAQGLHLFRILTLLTYWRETSLRRERTHASSPQWPSELG